VDIISGGFPCQDISECGKGMGIAGSRSGLWKEMARIVGEVKPRYVIIENSAKLLIRGFEVVLCDLSKIGYHAEWTCLSNADFGFDHIRERVYVIAYSDEVRRQARRVQRPGEVASLFIPPSGQYSGFSISERVHQMRDSEHIGINDGITDWTHRVGAIGNAVNAVVAKWLFECILIYDKNLKA
jgi:DNA (cytosine-5)-methyltransferase 1